MTSSQKLITWSFALFFFLVGVFILRDVLLPFVAGMAMAYFLDPITTKLETKIKSRMMALMIVFLVLIVVLLLGFFIVVPIIQKQLSVFIKNLPVYANLFWVNAEPYILELKRMFPEQIGNLRETVSNHLSSGFNILLSTVHKLLSRSVALINLISILLITPVVAFYLLRDWKAFCNSMLSLLPRQEAKIINGLLDEVNDIVSGFLRGQASVCLVLGIFYAIGLTFAGLDLGLLIGLAIGALSFIPYVGSTLGLIISVSLALVQFDSWERVAVVVVIFFVGQTVEGNVLTPKLVGEKVGLHPVWVMFSLLAGASLFGFLGVLIAVPAAAVIGVFVRFSVQKYKESSLYLGNDIS